MTDDTFHNASRTAIRAFMLIAAAFGVAGGIAVIAYGVDSRHNPHPSQTPLLVCFLTAPLAVSMLLSALLTLPTAKRTDRAFEQFRRGDMLLRWDYSPQFWLPYVEAEIRRVRSSACVLYILIFGVTTALAVFIGVSVVQAGSRRVEFFAILVGSVAILSLGYCAAVRAILRLRRNALLACPRAYIGAEAVYCGGIFNFWGSQLRALQSLRVVKGNTTHEPAVLEFIVGLSRGGRSASGVVDAVSLLAGRPSFASTYTAKQTVPIPPQELDRAEELVRKLTSSDQLTAGGVAPTATTPARDIRGRTQAAVMPLQSRHHNATSLRRSAKRWLLLMVVLLVGGLCLFLAGAHLDPNHVPGHETPALATALDVAGLFAWVAAPLTLLIAIVQAVRGRLAQP